jgi:putative zinc finger/helix-turn-helix YgiT family protein
MKTIKSEKKLCLICMEEHEVQTVIMRDTEEFKGLEVSFDSTYEYCNHADEYLETEDMIKANSLAMKDAYRKKTGLLTSSEIINIREKYGVSQKDFSEILDWGGATVTRYENHQVQDRAHDDVLRKIESDPKWFLQMLKRAEDKISEKAFYKYLRTARLEYRELENSYLIDSIQALYANFEDDNITGGVELNLNKVLEIINYYASNVCSLHKVKLMKMLWYGDNLSYKRRGKPITGLVYCALPMGAVPVGYEQILGLDGIEFEMFLYDFDRMAYRFYPEEGFKIKELTAEDIEILDAVIAEVGHLNSQDIIDKMHNEDVYKCTGKNCIIPFSYAEKLSID